MRRGVRVRRRRLIKLAAPLVLGSMLLAACGDDKPSGTPTGGTKKTVKIAYQGPLSGDNRALGENMRNAVQLAVEEADKRGDLAVKLVFVESDDQGTPDGGPPAARKLIDDKDVMAVVGPAFSGATKASEPLFSQANLMSVSPSATNDTLTSQGFTTFARVVPPDSAQGREAANYVIKVLKPSKVFSVNDKSEYGLGLAKIFEENLKKAGIAIGTEAVAPTADYSAVVTKAKSSGAPVVFYSGYFAEFALLAKQLRAGGYTGQLMSGDGSNDDKFIEGAGAASENALITCPCADARIDPKAASFAAAYKAKFGRDVGAYSPESYDAANAIISVIKALGTDVTREKVVAGVKAVDYQGLTKQVKFLPNGEVSGEIVFLYEVKGGKRLVKGTTVDLTK